MENHKKELYKYMELLEFNILAFTNFNSIKRKEIIKKLILVFQLIKKEKNQKEILQYIKNQLKVQFQLKFQIIQIKILMNTKII